MQINSTSANIVFAKGGVESQIQHPSFLFIRGFLPLGKAPALPRRFK